jgi:hypothetical protein
MGIKTKANSELSEFPDPVGQLKYLAPAVMEILEGVRAVSQVGGLVTEEIYQRLKERSAAQARERFGAKNRKPWPNIKVTRIHHEFTTPNVVQAVVLLSNEKRTRAAAIRLEGRNHRWIATAVSVL